jgi:predicted dehydrogenase
MRRVPELKKWGIAVLGCGGIADFHLRALQEIEAAGVVGVFSRSEEKVRSVGEKYGCDWTTQAEALVARADVEVVDVATSSGSHYALAKLALEHGKHVIVEKPITMLPEQARELIALAERRGVTLGVISQRRFEAGVQAAKAAVDAGRLGKLLLVEARTPFYRTQEYYDSAPWRGTLAEDGGAMMNQGIHQIDLLLWFGGKVRSVFGKTATQLHRMEAEDMGLAIVSFESGALGTIMSSTNIQPGRPASIAVYGEKGSIVIDGGEITTWHVPGVDEPAVEKPANKGGGANDPLSISYLNHRKQLEQFLQAIETGTAPLVTGEDGRRAVELIYAVYESARTGKEIYLGDA